MGSWLSPWKTTSQSTKKLGATGVKQRTGDPMNYLFYLGQQRIGFCLFDVYFNEQTGSTHLTFVKRLPVSNQLSLL